MWSEYCPLCWSCLFILIFGSCCEICIFVVKCIKHESVKNVSLKFKLKRKNPIKQMTEFIGVSVYGCVLPSAILYFKLPKPTSKLNWSIHKRLKIRHLFMPSTWTNSKFQFITTVNDSGVLTKVNSRTVKTIHVLILTTQVTIKLKQFLSKVKLTTQCNITTRQATWPTVKKCTCNQPRLFCISTSFVSSVW